MSSCASKKKVSRSNLPYKSLRNSISQYGITWYFDKEYKTGRFANGDYWVLGPARIVAIDPAPGNGRNGSAIDLNVQGQTYATGRVCWDDRIKKHRYDPKNEISLPLILEPGDSLISTVSVEKAGLLSKMLRGGDTSIPTRTAAVLTCLIHQAAADAFRPGYSDPESKIYYVHDIERDLLPQLKKPASVEDIAKFERYLERPWLDIAYDEFTAPPENMPVYGREYTRIISIAALLLCLDYSPEEKETLLIRLVQLGIDLRGLMKAGFIGWPAVGGHGNGRKLPILLAGRLLGEDDMQRPDLFFPEVKFSEDMQTMYDKCWTGASVVFAGHAGQHGHPKHADWGAYEHLHPSKWPGTTGEKYRRCCTSIAWVGEATAAKLLGIEELWNHDAFFDYVERWMTEDDTKQVKEIFKETGVDFFKSWAMQGQAWDRFVEDMWHMYWFSVKNT